MFDFYLNIQYITNIEYSRQIVNEKMTSNGWGTVLNWTGRYRPGRGKGQGGVSLIY